MAYIVYIPKVQDQTHQQDQTSEHPSSLQTGQVGQPVELSGRVRFVKSDPPGSTVWVRIDLWRVTARPNSLVIVQSQAVGCVCMMMGFIVVQFVCLRLSHSLGGCICVMMDITVANSLVLGPSQPSWLHLTDDGLHSGPIRQSQAHHSRVSCIQVMMGFIVAQFLSHRPITYQWAEFGC